MNRIYENIFSKLRSIHFVSIRTHQGIKISSSGLRGDMLTKLISQKKKKKYCDTIRLKPSKTEGIFDRVSRPSRRVKVLNSVFIEQITDVISTGDVAPEIVGSGIEITGVKVSSDYTILNVYWEVPPLMYDQTPDLEEVLKRRAPQIRAELISRNVVGKVPHIFFVRDQTNAKAAAFEKALASADMGPAELAHFVPEDDYLKNYLEFDEIKKSRKSKETTKETPGMKVTSVPMKPVNMRTNILGLEHEVLMHKVLYSKRKENLERALPKQSSESDDLFSKIPGVPIHSNVDRNALLKTFCLERRKELEKLRKRTERSEEDLVEDVYKMSSNHEEDENFEPDYFDEDQLIHKLDEKEC